VPASADANVGHQCKGAQGGFDVPLSQLFVLSCADGAGLRPTAKGVSAFIMADYRTWNCRQLAEETDLVRDALAVASEQRSDETVAHLKAETEALHKASALKKCSAPATMDR
jgi:hypothetical protein